MNGRALVVLGTASNAGKTMLVAGLCRVFQRRGLKVAPFKAQNFALNAAVTEDGLEIGRAQAVQAEAACVRATTDMNPILLKPEGGFNVQVIVHGRSIGSMTFREYGARRGELEPLVLASLARLRESYELVIAEGAGSPAEINFEHDDLVNMFIARAADAPVLLVGDIERGGVFAALYGTYALLPEADRRRVAGFVINKLHGDPRLLKRGLDRLEQETGVPVLGVIPYLETLGLADEDSASMDQRRQRPRARPEEIEIAIVDLPHLSNFDDVRVLEQMPGVVVRFVRSPRELSGTDVVILPGSKKTVADLEWLRSSGVAAALDERARRGESVLGICGGCQMLGEQIEDPEGVESQGVTIGLGLLPLVTRFTPDKRTTRVRARIPQLSSRTWAEGYEIHQGRTRRTGGRAATIIELENGVRCRREDGAVEGSVIGTMIHGLFESVELCNMLLGLLRPGWQTAEPRSRPAHIYDRLADVLEDSLDISRIEKLIAPV